MKIFIASDHGGFELKKEILEYFNNFINLGANSTESCNYVIIAKDLCNKLSEISSENPIDKVENFGILICKSGIGMSIAANRFSKIRAGLCRNFEDIKLARMHNNINILCLGTNNITIKQAIDMIKIFLLTEFEGERHEERVKCL